MAAPEDLAVYPSQMHRRGFLKTSSLAGAAALLSPAWQHDNAQDAAGARVFVTHGKQRHEAAESMQFAAQPGTPDLSEAVVIDTRQRFQSILGFGAAFTDGSCFTLSQMPDTDRQALMRELFLPSEMNLSAGRCCVGASDYSRDVFSYDDTPGDSAMQHFSTAHDDAYILPILREARALQPGLFLLSSTWSPPAWMKVYGTMLGGYMSSKHLQDYAAYYVAFLESYRQKGVPIQALTTGNEVEAEQGGSMPATVWTAEMEADFIRDHLGPQLRKRKLDTKVWLLDHNYDLWKRVLWQLDDAELRKYVDGVAWHGYVGTPDMMSRVHDRHPDLPFYWTEGGPDYTSPAYETEWTRWGQTFTEALANWCRCIIGWNYALDKNGRPNIGPFSCGGMVTVEGGKVTRSGQYWAMRHFSQHIQRNAVRVASHSDATDLHHIAFAQPDGSVVAVLTNGGGERPMTISVNGRAGRLTLPATSIVTLVSGAA